MTCPAVMVCEVTTQVYVPDTTFSVGSHPPTGFAIIVLENLAPSTMQVPKGQCCRSTKDSSVGPHPKTKLSEALEKIPGLLGWGDWGWFSTDCTITKEASRRLPTVQARFRSQDSLLWNFCRQNGNGTRSFLEDLPFRALFIMTPTIHAYLWAMEIT
jgi:hypothetical protein